MTGVQTCALPIYIQRRALDIVGDATRAAPRKAPPVAAVPNDPHQSRRVARPTDEPQTSGRIPKAT